MTELDYAGDLDPQKAWNLLEQNKDCYLVDCRTNAEWNYVGVPDLNSIGKNVLFIEWQTYPLMEKNNNFLQEINVILEYPRMPNLFLSVDLVLDRDQRQSF